jgi:MFS family permease
MFKLLKQERSLSFLLGGNLLSRIGDGVHEFIYIVTVLKVTNNGVAHAGFIYFFRFIPYLILGPLGGALADKLKRKLLMLNADLARMLITSVFCALLVTNQIESIALAVIGMLMTAFRTIFQPAFQATIPSLVHAEKLPVANALAQIVAEIGSLLGPAIGAITLATIANPGQVLVIDVVTYLVSALCIWQVKPSTEHSSDRCGKLSLQKLYSEFYQNITHMTEKSQLFVTIAYSSACIFFVGAALRILIPAMLKDGGYPDSTIGYAMSLTALGAVIGAAAFTKVASDFSTRYLMLYWCFYGLVLAVLPACMPSTLAVHMGCFVLGIFGAFVDVVLPTNIHQLSTDANLGKNFSFFSTLANTGEALSGGFAGLLMLFSSVGFSVTIIGLLIASVAYVGKHRSEISYG